jgi:hypothetical protein
MDGIGLGKRVEIGRYIGQDADRRTRRFKPFSVVMPGNDDIWKIRPLL